MLSNYIENATTTIEYRVFWHEEQLREEEQVGNRIEIVRLETKATFPLHHAHHKRCFVLPEYSHTVTAGKCKSTTPLPGTFKIRHQNRYTGVRFG